MNKVRIGISIGDINGIGLEVILKTLADKRILQFCIPVIYGSTKVISYHKNIVKLNEFSYNTVRSVERLYTNEINVVNCWNETVNISLGMLNETGGKYALNSLEAVCNDLKAGHIDALVTAPINKKAVSMVGFNYPGHTEYLSDFFNSGRTLMLMASEDIKVGLVTNHLPLSEVSGALTKELIERKLKVLDETLKMDFGIERPKIGVLALNPHAGDEGTIGTEEQEIIIPAVKDMKRKGILAMGPYPADGFFGSRQWTKFDAVLAMYHDQGLIPFKALSFGAGVNYTAGLPVIRTSPDHGTAYDLAGKNEADPASFRKALFLAADIFKNRSNYMEMHNNPVQKTEHVREELPER